ncbi:hypothetical protein T4B_8220 [Trichinella pseudospiralis]|uniref:Uncharacterized protein n=1 Tax=Trichinella pseudospiralis TaxID=6337 RepID=A0A0V1K0U6_TRIPS|nr:hypothetical protein T4A_7599 [Trichinella pseudospiralis]KRZ25525.1 hypothetical protein T4B_8220 [Trichinella pseudospiralis]KRZ40712.1 hypothetical protein T4C_10531 [Trichinella pseudospiralis]
MQSLQIESDDKIVISKVFLVCLGVFSAVLETISTKTYLSPNKTLMSAIHISFEKMKTMMKQNLVDGLRVTAKGKYFCKGCVINLMTWKIYTKETERQQIVHGEILYTDVLYPSISWWKSLFYLLQK